MWTEYSLSNLKHSRRKRLIKFDYAKGRRKFSLVSHDSYLIALVYSLILRSTEFNYLRQCCRFQLDSRLDCSHSDLYTGLWRRWKRYQNHLDKFAFLIRRNFQDLEIYCKYGVCTCEKIINNIMWRKLYSI